MLLVFPFDCLRELPWFMLAFQTVHQGGGQTLQQLLAFCHFVILIGGMFAADALARARRLSSVKLGETGILSGLPITLCSARRSNSRSARVRVASLGPPADLPVPVEKMRKPPVRQTISQSQEPSADWSRAGSMKLVVTPSQMSAGRACRTPMIVSPVGKGRQLLSSQLDSHGAISACDSCRPTGGGARSRR